MKMLQKHVSDESPRMATNTSRGAALATLRHYIGRLGSHLRAARIIATAAYRLPDLFESFVIKVLPSAKPPTLPPPADNHTTLDGIIKRVLPVDSDEIQLYIRNLFLLWNSFIRISYRFMREIDS